MLFDAVAVVFAAEPTDHIVCIIDEKQRIFDVERFDAFLEYLVTVGFADERHELR